MKKVFTDYMNKDMDFNKKEKITLFFMLVVFSGVFGWIYEFIFYYFNDGKFSFQGGNFLPWINIYAIGSLLIILTTYKVRKKPLFVFLISSLVTGLLEYFSGLLIYIIGNGARYWDYNVEIWNFGNIGGFVCFRSVFVFGLSALLLVYIILPYFIYLIKKCNLNRVYYISLLLFTIIMFDEFYNLIFTKTFNLPSAHYIYKSIGLK